MQQTCSKCGAVATVPSKFCRNCGGPLPEAPATEAPTRQYGRQTPAGDVPPTSSPFTGPGQPPPPSVADAFAPDTARLHGQQNVPPGGQSYGQSYGQPYGQPPMPVAYQPGNPVPYPVQPAPKSNWWKWLLGVALASLLVCGGLLGYAFKRASDAVPNVQKQIETAIAEAQKEAERAAKEAGVPNAPGAPAGAGSELSIEQLRYPKSEQTTRVNVMGNQVLELKTEDNLPAVRAFYEKLLGAPLVESQEQGKKELVFQKVPYIVTIGHDRLNSDKLKINIVRSGWIPKLGENPPSGGSVPAPPPPPPPPGADGALNFDQLLYPNAQKGSIIKLNERSQLQTLTTTASLAEVRAFYEQRLGVPLTGAQVPEGFDMIFFQPPYRINVFHPKVDPTRLQLHVIRYNQGPIPPVLPAG